MTRKPFILVCCLLAIYSMDASAQAPVADFSATPVSGCGPLGVYFTDHSTGSPLFWSWDFGNGVTSKLQNPITEYDLPGLYTVKLKVVNKNGQDSITKINIINVAPYPIAAFTANFKVACAPAGIQFTDQTIPGQGGIATWLWQFGDGATSTQPNPSHTYSQPGYYDVSLHVTNSAGCSNAITQTRFLRVVPGVQSDFAFAQTSNSCSAPFLLNFTNQTAGPGTLNYTWDFGNGAPLSNQTNPSTSYPANTNYTVTLTTQSSFGCSDTAQRIISFPAGNAVITAPDSICANNPVNFKNGSSPAPLSSAWSFGDGNTSNAPNPSNTYPITGNYPVKLVNTYSTCVDSVTKTIAVVNSPTADFTAPKTDSCKGPFTVSFKDASTPSAGLVKWQWDFGDGTTSNLQNPVHTYTTTDSFDVKLTITNSAGCSATITKLAFVKIHGPITSLLIPLMQGCVNTTIFQPIAIINSVDPITSYSWNSGGGVPATSTSATPSFTYPTQSIDDITLTVTTSGGCSSTNVFKGAVTVGTATPALLSAISDTLCRNQPIILHSTSSPAQKWIWNFGDGVFTETDTPGVHHTYIEQGSYNISLTVVNNGCSQGANLNSQAIVNPPVAKFGFATQCGANKYVVNFTDSSEVLSTLATTYTWDFGDGTTVGPFTQSAGNSPAPPIAHTYTTLGPHVVNLTVSNASCTDVATRTVTLDSLIASFSVLDTLCRTFNYTMISTSSHPELITDYSWKIGGNPIVTTGTTPSEAFQPTSNGPLPLALTITDTHGCQFTSQPFTAQVLGPTAKFDTTGPGGCKNGLIPFTDQSVADAVDPIVVWSFGFGDGLGVDFNGPPYTHKYADTGYYNVILSVRDTRGCIERELIDSAVRITAPHAGFFAADTLYCPNIALPFTDSSRGHNLTWFWDFGDGAISSAQNPAPVYPTNGQRYSISLKVTDIVGCSDSLTRTGYIHIQSPIAAFTIQDSTTICIPLQTNFIPNAQYYDSLYWDFGDGTTSTLPKTAHFYNSFGTFTAKLFLRGNGGCMDSASRNIFVLDPGFTSLTYNDPLTKCDSVPMNFVIVPPGYTKFTLFFGDLTADSSGSTTPFHMFKVPNSYTQQLQLQDSTGCIVDISGSKVITVLGAVPFFSIDKHAFCDSSNINFTDFTSTNDMITSETWIFGDGISTMLANPSHDYTMPGIYFPSLQVTTASGCMETYTDTVKAFQTPHPTFTFSAQPCAKTPVQFTGDLNPADPDQVIWAWDFGNGQTSSLQDPLITYSQSGFYKVSLKTSIPFGCGDTTSRQIDLRPLPSISGPAAITIAEGFPTVLPFTYKGGIVSYSWTPVTNLSCSDCPNPLAGPIFSTQYKILVTDSNNCSITDSVLVKTVCNGQNYFIPNTFSPNGDGVNDVFYPRGNNLYNVQSMRVFNRWGQMVFEKRDFPANSAPAGWDGTFNGHPSPVDVYAYVIEVVCDNAQVIALNGNITLVR